MLGNSVQSIQAEQPQPDREGIKKLDVAVWAHRALLPSHRVCASGKSRKREVYCGGGFRAHALSLRRVFVFFDGLPVA